MPMNAHKAVDVVIEGARGANIDALAIIASSALRQAGFTHASRVYLDEVTGCVEKQLDLDYATPSVMQQLRDNNPEFFRTPVIISAHNPPEFPAERRRYDRALLQATAIASVITDDDDPDEIWANMPDWQKYKALRSM